MSLPLYLTFLTVDGDKSGSLRDCSSMCTNKRDGGSYGIGCLVSPLFPLHDPLARLTYRHELTKSFWQETTMLRKPSPSLLVLIYI